ncbi:MAG: MarR family transcriptional regulator [Nitrosarchaeum sp.]|nr:MarR family transcriptional regulator [Nitrosarchaeum sp.]
MDLKQMLDVDNSLGILIKLTGKSFEKAVDIELKEKCGLTAGQGKIIIALALQEGQSQKEISNAMFLDGSTLVPIIDKMENNGFVVRKSNPKDRRNHKIYLTQKSKALIDLVARCVLDIRRVATQNISETQLNITKKVLKQLTANTEQHIEKKSNQIKVTSKSQRISRRRQNAK